MRLALAVALILGGCGEPVAPTPEAPLVEVEPTTSSVVPLSSAEEPEPPDDDCSRLQARIHERAGEIGGLLMPMKLATCSRVAAGSSLTVEIVLEPGRCLVALAQAPDADLELRLITKMPQLAGGPLVLAASTTTGPRAEIGVPDCFRNPLPLPVPAALEARSRDADTQVALEAFVK
jgi:hypothetical protein